MNADMLAAGVELGDRYDFDLVHGHDWLVAMACDHLARRFDAPLVTTIHATEHGRHQGWVDKHPQSLHPRRRALDHQPRRPGDRLLVLHARADRRHLRRRRGAGRGDPERDRPRGPAAPGRARARPAARRVRGARREARPADRPARLREGLSARARGDAAADRGRPRDALSGRRLGHPRAGAARAGGRARADGPRHLPRLDRRRRPALALPDRRRLRRPLDLRAVRPRRARGDGVGLPLHRRRHRRPARGRPPRRGRAAVCAPATRGRSARWSSACSTDAELCDRLVAEGSEHILRFDWADVAESTAAVYAELARDAARA